MMREYDVIVVGAGPAGIFAALELVRENELNVLILEGGADIERRTCPARVSARDCTVCRTCSITSGWGGAGAFSDGKLTLCQKIGGWLDEYIDSDTLNGLIDHVDKIYLEFGAPADLYGTAEEEIDRIRKEAIMADLTLIDCRIRHMGTDRCADVLGSMRDYIDRRATIKTGVHVSTILTDEKAVAGVRTDNGEDYFSRNVIIAPGRHGSDWLSQEAKRIGLSQLYNSVDIGVRVEVPKEVMRPLTDTLYESKLIYYSKSFQDEVRTFCMNPGGFVAPETYGDVVLVNGHSFSHNKSENTNFALLVSTSFTEPFKEPTAYGKYIARLANLLGNGIIIQSLGDLYLGRRSTAERIERSTVKPTYGAANPGDLSFVLPYRYIKGVIEMLEALDKLAPGVNSRNTLLYGVEAKFYSSRMKLTGGFETEVRNLYAIGDGAGITRGLVQSSCSGVVAARSILAKSNGLEKKRAS